MVTSNSGANHAVMHAQITRRSLGPIETCNSYQKVTVLHAKITNESRDPYRLVILHVVLQGLGPMETSNSCANHAVMHAQITRRSLGLIETCNSDQKSPFGMQKPQMRAGTHTD